MTVELFMRDWHLPAAITANVRLGPGKLRFKATVGVSGSLDGRCRESSIQWLLPLRVEHHLGTRRSRRVLDLQMSRVYYRRCQGPPIPTWLAPHDTSPGVRVYLRVGGIL